MRRLVPIALAAVLLTVPACSDDDDASTTTAGGDTPVDTTGDAAPSSTAGGEDASGSPFIEDLEFHDLEVAAGAEVTVENRDPFQHTFSFEDGSVTVALGGDDSGTFTATEAGSYPIFCEIHPTMTGTLVVS